ncbi:phosphoglycerate kinase [Candidatus Dependentiae bacterium]
MKLKNIDLKHKRVFLRADLNVPLQNQQILQDHKLNAILPTINYIQENGGKVILATHLGRPNAQNLTNFFDKDLSTKILLSWFLEREYQIKLERDLEKSVTLSHEDFGEILLLENLRFFNGEKGNLEERQNFIEYLKPLADIYINDAFALIHRDDTSVTLLPQNFECSKRCWGFLIQKEITALNELKDNVKQPFILVVGGNKIKDKITLLKHFLELEPKNRPCKILIGGAIANTFLYSQGIEVGKSFIEKDFVDFIQNFLKQAENKNIKIVLPKDFLTVKEIGQEKLQHHQKESIPLDEICIDIGKTTIKEFEEEIFNAKTIFTNGSMGIYTNPSYQNGTKKILEAISQSNSYKVAGGGDCVAAIKIFGVQDKFDFISTGGGATLAYLSTNNPIQNLEALRVLECKD